MNDVIHEMDEQMHHDIEERGWEVNLELVQYHDDLFLQRVELLQADRFPRDDVEEVAEAKQCLTDVLVHYPLDRNGKYLHHQYVTVVRLHPTEPLLRFVEISAYVPRVTMRNFNS
jgi:hypothetical protein